MNNLDNNTLSQKLIGLIESIIKSFRTDPDVYLTEEDIRCHLFSVLIKDLNINKVLFNTKDGSRSIPTHSEVRWYGSSGKLRYRSDIVILDPRDLRTKDGKMELLPSKAYGFNHYWAIIEIKLRRLKGVSDKAFAQEIEQEVNKLKGIKIETESRNKYQPILIVLGFDKKNDIGNLVNCDDEEVIVRYICSKHV